MKIFKSENFIIFLIVFTLACIAGFYINFKLKIIFGDALVRSFHAYLVFFGNEPKLSAIGFVWPPLPTLLQLPLVLIKPLNISGIAGNILSSIFFGIIAVYVNLLAIFFKLKKIFRFIILFLFITNPLIFFYGINGMSEIIGICFIIMTLYYLFVHISSQSIPSLVLTSLALSCAVMTRWETGVLLFIVLFIIVLIPFLNKKYSFRELESSLVLFTIPVLFVIFIWLIASWLIVGSPTYFLHSTYSFTAQDAKQLASNSVLNAARGNVGLSFMFVLERIIYLSAVFIPFFILVFTKLRNKANRLYVLTMLGFALSVILAHTMLIYFGKSYGELRYFIYVIPFSYIFLLFLFKDTLKVSLGRYTIILLFSLSAMLILISSGLTYYAMSLPKYGNQEHILIDVLLNKHNDSESYTFKKEAQIANYISTHIQTRSVLVDDSVGFIIIYLTRKPHLFIETVDSDFKQTLNNPVHSKAKYLLISDQESHSGVDILNVSYPTLFKTGGDFVTLEKDFGDWRLYKILAPGEKAKESPKAIVTKNNCTHLVVSGESLWGIAKKDFGNGLIYKEIFEQNKDLLIKPSLIHPGENISIPCIEDL
jgi:hypothetical protein